jgi:hypothetical protein
MTFDIMVGIDLDLHVALVLLVFLLVSSSKKRKDAQNPPGRRK